MNIHTETPALIVPSAGRGSRLKAAVPKFLVPVGGRPMIHRIAETYAPYVSRLIVIVGPGWEAAAADAVRKATDRTCNVVVQERPTGMLDAVLAARPIVESSSCGRVWITWCDQVGIQPRTLARLADTPADAAMNLPTVKRTHPYIHFDRTASGTICGVRHRREGDVMPPIGEGDAGLFSLSRRAYLVDLPEYAAIEAPGELTGERNFLPFIPWLAARGDVHTFPCADRREAIGINTPDDLAAVEEFLLVSKHLNESRHP